MLEEGGRCQYSNEWCVDSCVKDRKNYPKLQISKLIRTLYVDDDSETNRYHPSVSYLNIALHAI